MITAAEVTGKLRKTTVLTFNLFGVNQKSIRTACFGPVYAELAKSGRYNGPVGEESKDLSERELESKFLDYAKVALQIYNDELTRDFSQKIFGKFVPQDFLDRAQVETDKLIDETLFRLFKVCPDCKQVHID